ncbi:MAG: ABC transporter permease [Defluviitaleaceae bacterium]|nr:ABC transporter permease [Defluviitaleaceae bacterium]
MNLTIFKNSLRRGFMNPTSLVANCALPLIILVFIADSDINIMGMAQRSYHFVAITLMFGAFFMARGIQRDKIEGTVIRILAGPVSMRSYLISNFFASMVPMVGVSIALGVLGVVIHGWALDFAALLTLCYALLAATSIGLSFVWSCLFKDKETAGIAFSVTMMIVAFFSGLMIPLDDLPSIVFHVGALFPAHWAARAIDALVLNGAENMFWISMLAMMLFAVAYLIYGGKRRII